MIKDDLAVRISLPFPPSVNALFLNVRGRGRVRTQAYRKWADEAGWLLKSQRPASFKAPVKVAIEVNPPNRRARDLDNLSKPVMDLLVTHQVIPDDSIRYVRGVSVSLVEVGAPCTVIVEPI